MISAVVSRLSLIVCVWSLTFVLSCGSPYQVNKHARSIALIQ
jgi:hypothetical protein